MLPTNPASRRAWKRRIVFSIDALLLAISPPVATMLHRGEIISLEQMADRAAVLLLLTVLGLVLERLLWIPSIKLSTFDVTAVFRIGIYALTLSLAGIATYAVLLPGVSFSVPVIFGALMLVLMLGWRVLASAVLAHKRQRGQQRIPIAIYGAGAAGMQLIAALGQHERFRIIAVVDDSPGLRGVIISGFRVQAPAVLGDLARAGRIQRIVLAMPSVAKRRQRQIVGELEKLPCEVHATPGYPELVSAGDLLGSVKSVSSDDLLGRTIVDLDIPDVAKAFAGRSVLISGAGGSIGSELCRQVLSCRPRRIVLFEISEFALYTIDREIRPLAEEARVEVVTTLGSVCDRTRVRAVMQQNKVEIVLHAAAYKHVPIVESNEVEGVRNNVLGTRIMAEIARELGVERFILISTDKAVRPSNIMGATKRMAEMVVQDLQSRCTHTKFAMVRFGNVLGSSGSVIPLFSSQIAAGGPITLTHPEVTRYFMTISEAARLVLLAGSYATGGDVFVLDMGQPTRIMELARRMVGLSGLTVKDAQNPDGDIEILVTGLRPGEKLYEELLIGGATLPTPHRKILRAQEHCPSEIEVAGMLQELRLAVEANSPAAIRRQIVRTVEGYRAAEPDAPAPPAVQAAAAAAPPAGGAAGAALPAAPISAVVPLA